MNVIPLYMNLFPENINNLVGQWMDSVIGRFASVLIYFSHFLNKHDKRIFAWVLFEEENLREESHSPSQFHLQSFT